MQLKSILGFFSGASKVSGAMDTGAGSPPDANGAPSNMFTSPLSDTTIHAGQTMELTWENLSGPEVDLSAVCGDPSNLQEAAVIGTHIANQGSHYWTVPVTLAPGKYAIKLVSSTGMNFSPFFAVYDPVSVAQW